MGDVLDNIVADLNVIFSLFLIIEKLSNLYANFRDHFRLFIYNCKDGNLLLVIFENGIVVVYIKARQIDVKIFLNYLSNYMIYLSFTTYIS